MMSDSRSCYSHFVCLVLIHTSLLFVSGSRADEEVSDWVVHGDAKVVTQMSTLRQLTGQVPFENHMLGRTVAVEWPIATIRADGREPLRANMALSLITGHTMRVGADTPYPGLVTKLRDAVGTLTDLDTGYKVKIRLSERGNWIGAFVHSDSRGMNHLAFELPLSLYDATSDELIAQNNLIVGFDLTESPRVRVRSAFFSPTPFAEQRSRTTDIGNAVRSQRQISGLRSSTVIENIEARIVNADLVSVSSKASIDDIFSSDALSRFACLGDDYLELKLDSDGLSENGLTKSPAFELRVRFAPAMIADGTIAYLDPLIGSITLFYENFSRLITIGPGNHGLLASSVSLLDDGLDFDLGIALHEGTGRPTLARLQISCISNSVGDIECEQLHLKTAMDSNGHAISPTTLSDLLERNVATMVSISGLTVKDSQAFGEGGPTPCPPGCQSCMTEGCDQGGICDELGAPMNCGSGCDHYPNTYQCCQRASTRLCCVERCATPP